MKKTCLLVEQKDTSSCWTKTCLLVEKEDMSSFLLHKKTCLLVQQDDMFSLVQQEDMSSYSKRRHLSLLAEQKTFNYLMPRPKLSPTSSKPICKSWHNKTRKDARGPRETHCCTPHNALRNLRHNTHLTKDICEKHWNANVPCCAIVRYLYCH